MVTTDEIPQLRQLRLQHIGITQTDPEFIMGNPADKNHPAVQNQFFACSRSKRQIHFNRPTGLIKKIPIGSNRLAVEGITLNLHPSAGNISNPDTQAGTT